MADRTSIFTTDARLCPGADACAWPGICLPGRCIAAEAAASPNFSVFSSHERSNLAVLVPHCPPGLALLRGLPDGRELPPDRQPAAPRHLPRGGHLLAALAWCLACWAALGGAAWMAHWLIYN